MPLHDELIARTLFRRLGPLLVVAGVLGTACGDSKPEDGADAGGGPEADAGVFVDGGSPFPASFTFTVVDDANAGFAPELVRAPDGKLGLAYLRQGASPGTCSRVTGNPTIARYEVMYVDLSAATPRPERVATVDTLNLDGIALAFDDASAPAIAFMGGDEGAYRCGGSDVLLARRGARTWTTTTIDTDGHATPTFAEDVLACAMYQDACNAGDVVGSWPALAFVGGQPAVAYRDIHFGFAQDDEQKSDLELSWNGRLTLDATTGGGNHTRIVVDGAGRPAVAHTRRFLEPEGGIWVLNYDGAAWSRQKVAPVLDVEYRLAFAASGPKLGLAYYDGSERRLKYLESADGATWTRETTVDTNGLAGASPALAFDAQGRAALSYHRCGPYDPNSSDCAIDKDGLMYAVRVDGTFRTMEVRNERAGFDGLHTALAFDQEGLPVIAFQQQFTDAASSTQIRQMVVARGRR